MRVFFNVFGKSMSVERREGEWLLYQESETSIRRRVYDIYIPNDVECRHLAQYLADMYHENATERFPSVQRTKSPSQ